MHHGRYGKMSSKNKSFWSGKRVLVTGDTGFKGTWLCKMLIMAGAEVIGYALNSPTKDGELVFRNSVLPDIRHICGDIRDIDKLKRVFVKAKPEIVFHLAAQPLVLKSYEDPLSTYETNVIGTVNVLECIRHSQTVKSFLNVTTDKVYENKEWEWGYREIDSLDGYDPYSNSKSCSELVTHSYAKSFLTAQGVSVSTARAGNVIGGGDFAENRIIPDCIRSAIAGKTIVVRNPNSIRPYQHVLEPLSAYMLIAERQMEDRSLAGWYNVGPSETDCLSTGALADLFCRFWRDKAVWKAQRTEQPHEASLLKLDCSKIRNRLGWYPRWTAEQAIEKTVEWAKCYHVGKDYVALTEHQIEDFMEW